MGRFTAVDPYEGDIYAPASLHRYLYTANDPVNNIDPSGMMEFSLIGISVSIEIQGDIRKIEGLNHQSILLQVRQKLSNLGLQSFKAASKVRKAGQQTHHLLEQRLWKSNPALKKLFSSVDDIPCANLSTAEHQAFTNAWRLEFPYSNQVGYVAQPTLEEIIGAASRVYANYPQLFNAVLSFL